MKAAIMNWSLAGALCVCFAGCIPSEPSEPQPDPLPSEEFQWPIEEPVATPPREVEETPPPGVGRMRMDMQTGVNAGVQVAPREGGGYRVEGLLGTASGSKLEGTILPKEGGGWVLEGEFTFMTGGYAVGEPFASFLGSKLFGGPQVVEGPTSTTMIISIPVTTPSKDAVVTKAISTEPIRMELDAPEDTTFSVVFISGL